MGDDELVKVRNLTTTTRREPARMLTLGILGAGQFAGQFATLFRRHPDVADIWVADLHPDRSAELVASEGLSGTFDDFDAMLASDVDAVAIFTQRWTHGPLVMQALRAGKHVYSAVPMATTSTTWISASTRPTSTAAATTGKPQRVIRRCSTRPIQ